MDALRYHPAILASLAPVERCRRPHVAARCHVCQLTGTSVLKVENGLITEEIGLDDGVTVIRQLGLLAG
jgi:hypothetical protein